MQRLKECTLHATLEEREGAVDTTSNMMCLPDFILFW